MFGFYYKYFLKLFDFTLVEFNSLLQLVVKLKVDKKSGKEEVKFIGKNIVFIFEKDSICIRCFFEVVVYDQGVRVIYFGLSGSQIGYKESIKDIVCVLGCMYDGIQYRGYGQEIVEILVEYVGVSVWNGLINEFYFMQLLVDFFIMQEYLFGKVFNEMTLVYVGDVCNNMGNSMFEVAVFIGLDLCLVALQVCWLEVALVMECCVLVQ